MRLIDVTLKNLRRRKGRMFLLIFGLSVGVATAVALTTVTETLESDIATTLDEYGANILIVPKASDLAVSYSGITVATAAFDVGELTLADLDAIETIENAANVSVVSPKLLGAVQLQGRTMLLAGVPTRRRRKRALALLEATGLRSNAYSKVHNLSGGEQQRLALCVALALGPQLLLADEPTGELDTETSLGIYDLLRRMSHEGGLSILVVTHDVALAQRTDRVVRLADGRMATQGRFETRELLAVDRRGMVQIPRELLIEAGIEDEVTARLVEEGILLEPTGGDDGD